MIHAEDTTMTKRFYTIPQITTLQKCIAGVLCASNTTQTLGVTIGSEEDPATGR